MTSSEFAEVAMPIDAGCFEDDAAGREASVRSAVSERIAARKPIYPNRSLGLEFAALNNGPRGYPIAAVALANLRVGESFVLSGRRHTVLKFGKTLTFEVEGQPKSKRLVPDSSKWAGFERDVDGLLSSAAHGCTEQAGDLLIAWSRDPVSQYNNRSNSNININSTSNSNHRHNYPRTPTRTHLS